VIIERVLVGAFGVAKATIPWSRVNTPATRGCLACFTTVVLALLTGCAASPPEEPEDLCAIFEEKSNWYKDARRMRTEWGVPISVGMAFTVKESSYVHDARPPRIRLLGVIPWRRPSSAYGYAQATNEAWYDYQKETGRQGADRAEFGDAIDFIGWYNAKSHRRLGIAKNDPYHLYIAYHEGRSGYAAGGWKNDAVMKDRARRVASRAGRYRAQLISCEESLQKDPWWHLW
jgi:hypothetical protein